MTILRANPVLAVHDLDGMARWITDVFDTENEEVDEGNWIFCRADSMIFMLGHCPEAMAAGDTGDHSYHSYVVVDDVDAVHDRVVARGVAVSHAPVDEPWGMREFSVHSPEGHRFMLGQVIAD